MDTEKMDAIETEEDSVGSLVDSAKKQLRRKFNKLPLGWIILVLLLIIAVLILVICLQHKKTVSVPEDPNTVIVTPDIDVTVDTVREVIAPAAELVSYKYFYTNADTYANSKKWFGDHDVPFTKEATVFIYTGEIDVGIDLNDIAAEDITVDNVTKTIIVVLPELKVISHEIDSDNFKAYDVKKSIFTESSLQNYADTMAALKEKQEAELETNKEFWDAAKSSIKSTLSSLLLTADITHRYSVYFSFKVT